ncbi:hypothetical protein AOQ84DRAFT_224942 [Glonium stellatum]|uniref:Uncharacterized protein n=1 Tax=Glonium stellatum TaxID=574774 RepID=A0A8E2EV04_9PEZI|nr:hypothetical protein AOQ84DRAFT_224942 [Glonium stellatum]
MQRQHKAHWMHWGCGGCGGCGGCIGLEEGIIVFGKACWVMLGMLGYAGYAIRRTGTQLARTGGDGFDAFGAFGAFGGFCAEKTQTCLISIETGWRSVRATATKAFRVHWEGAVGAALRRVRAEGDDDGGMMEG